MGGALLHSRLHRRCTHARAQSHTSRTNNVHPQGQSAHHPLAARGQLPLYGKRILVTAPRQYASKLVQLLVEAGARPVWLPGVEISALDDGETEQLDTALANLATFTHIAFTSKNAIHAVMSRLADVLGGRAAAAQALAACSAQLCTLGADGLTLRQVYGLEAQVSPPEASTQGLVRELERRGDAQGACVLCAVPLVAGGLVEPPVVPRFLEALEAAGAMAHRVACYRTAPGVGCPAECTAERVQLLSGGIDAIAFSSTAEAQGLCIAMGGRQVLAGAVRTHGVLLAAHGPYTAAGAADVLGLPVPCISADCSDFSGLVAALGRALSGVA